MRYPLWLVGGVAVLGAVLVLALVPIGCEPSDKTKATTTEKKVQEDPWLKAVIALRQDSDAVTCRRVLNELNQALASAPVDSQRKLGDAEAALAQSALNPSEAELKEIRSSGYTALDPNHLADGLYLRDVARSLDLGKLPVAERARIALEWVCRQVVLNPWTTPTGQNTSQPNPPLPPTYVLRRGWGSGLERMFVFVALCRQLEIEACLIGPAAAADQGVLHRVPGKEKEFPRGPFWGLGVRDGSDILLFDPWKEQALPGKNGRPATLADVRANPREMAAWLDNQPFAWPVTVDDLKTGEIFLIASLSSVAPRNKTLEEKLAADIGVKLFANLAEMKKMAEIAAKGVPVRFYSPANEPFGPTRALGSFLPVADGGTAVDAPNSPSLSMRFLPDQLPRREFAIPPGFAYSEPKQRLSDMIVGTFAGAFLNPMMPTPREKLQRGQFVEVTQNLVRLRDQFGAADARKKTSDAATAATAIKEWTENLNALYDQLNAAGPGDKATLRAQIEELWRPTSPIMNSIVGTAVAQPGIAEATFLIALAKHEQAERAGAKVQRLATVVETDPGKKAAAAKALSTAQTAATDAWAEARDWWSRYGSHVAFQSPNYPGRAELAKRLTDRANAVGGK